MSLEEKLKPFCIDIFGGDYIHPKHLKIDYFCDVDRNYIELGLYYLSEEVDKENVPDLMSERLDRLKKLSDYEQLPDKHKIVYIYFIDDCVRIGDGTHRIITNLQSRDFDDRYEIPQEPKSLDELIKWGKKNFKDPEDIILSGFPDLEELNP